MTSPELTAGPALDARIAETMGWTHLRIGNDRGDWVGAPYPEAKDLVHVPAYTTTGNGLLLMMEWMRAKPRGNTVELSLSHHGWANCIIRWLGIYIQADTPNLAVAAALLAAVEASE